MENNKCICLIKCFYIYFYFHVENLVLKISSLKFSLYYYFRQNNVLSFITFSCLFYENMLCCSLRPDPAVLSKFQEDDEYRNDALAAAGEKNISQS